MIEVRASAQAMKQLGGAAEELTTILMKLATSGSGADQALKDLLSSGQLWKTTQKDFDALMKELDINENSSVVITVNFIHPEMKSDLVFFSNVKRYQYCSNTEHFNNVKKIVTSNVMRDLEESHEIVSFVKLIKCGWEHLDNSMILLLRLLDRVGVEKVSIAGFDGYSVDGNNHNDFISSDLNSQNASKNAIEINKEITEMLEDFLKNSNTRMELEFITASRFNM